MSQGAPNPVLLLTPGHTGGSVTPVDSYPTTLCTLLKSQLCKRAMSPAYSNVLTPRLEEDNSQNLAESLGLFTSNES
jgi:hypothetical protein